MRVLEFPAIDRKGKSTSVLYRCDCDRVHSMRFENNQTKPDGIAALEHNGDDH